MIRNTSVLIFLTAVLGLTAAGQNQKTTTLPLWKPGYLDIYHIHTGRGNSTFFILPDGTTALLDAGDLDTARFEQKNHPLKVTMAYPDGARRSGQHIADFIRRVLPAAREPIIDYAVISHFHGDHYGQLTPESPRSAKGAYRLTGITDVAEYIPIRHLMDRGLDYPVDLDAYYAADSTFMNYRRFVASAQANGMEYGALIPGRENQIALNRGNSSSARVSIRNLKAGSTIWSTQGDTSRELFPGMSILNEKGRFNENPLSIALKVTYGKFDYYTGADNTGATGEGIPIWNDVETPLSAIVGPVDAMVLNHHGNRDANNETFLRRLSPRVMVEQLWCSDQPGQELVHRINNDALFNGERDVFALDMHAETKVYMGPWLDRHYRSTKGHVLIRIAPGGEQYEVFVLEGKNLEIKMNVSYVSR